MSAKSKSNIATAAVLGVLIFLILGVPKFSSDPVQNAYDRCVSGQEKRVAKAREMGVRLDGFSKQIEMSCGLIKNVCKADPDGFMCKAYLNTTEEQFFHD